MMAFLYACTIAPLALLYQWLFLGIAGFTGSYVAGLAGLSCVNAGLFIPLLRLVSGIEAKEARLQEILAPQIKAIKQDYSGIEQHRQIKELYATYRYHPVLAMRSGLGVFLQLPFLVAAFAMLSSLPDIRGVSWWIITDLGKPDGLLAGWNLLPLIMTGVNLAVTATTKGFTPKARFQAVIIAILFLVLLYNAPAALLIFWTINNAILLVRNCVPNLGIRSHVPSFSWTEKIASRVRLPQDGVLFYLCLLLLVSLTACFLPSALLISDISVFDQSIGETIIGVLPYCLAVAFPVCVLRLLLSDSVRPLLTLLLVTLTLGALGYAFAYTGNYGALNVSILQHGERLAQSGLWQGDVLYALVVVMFVYWLYRSGMIRHLAVAFSCFICVFVGYALYGVMTVSGKSQIAQSELFPDYNNELFSFSRNQENILIFVLDQFTGGHIEDMLRESPELAVALDGFTWYPDTIATGENTTMSLGSIYGGPEFNPLLQTEEQQMSLMELMHKAYSRLPNYFVERGFRAAIADCTFYDEDFMTRHMDSRVLVVPKTGSDYLGYFMANAPEKTVIGDMAFKKPDAYISLLSLFRILPHSLRNALYDEGEWHATALNARQQSMWSTLNEVALFSSMGAASSVVDGPGTLKIVYSTFPHNPWFLLEDSLSFADDPYPATKGQLIRVNGILPEHYFTEKHLVRLLSAYFSWMKENNIYDNTTIILVSDHCEADSRMLYTALGLEEEGRETQWSNDGPYRGRPHALLLAKNAGDRGKLRISPSLMMNGDVPSLVCERIGGCPGIPTMRELMADNPLRVRTHAKGAWNIRRHPEKRYVVDSYYRITGTMFDVQNWQHLQDVNAEQ